MTFLQWSLLILLTAALIGIAKHWYSNHRTPQRAPLVVIPKTPKKRRQGASRGISEGNFSPFLTRKTAKTGRVVVQENLFPLDGKCPVCENEWFNPAFGQPFQHQCGCVYHTQCIQYCVRNGRTVCFFCGKPLKGKTWRDIHVH